MEFTQFVDGERMKREAIRESATMSHVFISHCSRDATTQGLKMGLVAALSSPEHGGSVAYWADFLDLLNSGAKNWRHEIEVAINKCTKLVAFVDREFLRSFNCITEVVSAMDKGKPVVPVILDDESAEVLSAPDGAHQVWSSSRDFSSYKDTVLFGVRLDEDRFKSWWFEFSSINYVMCRPRDFFSTSENYVITCFKKAVLENILAQEKNAFLHEKFVVWNASGRQPAYLVPKREIDVWKNFVATMYDPLHAEYISESEIHHRKKYERKRAIAWIVFGFITIVCIISTSLFSFAIVSARRNPCKKILL